MEDNKFFIRIEAPVHIGCDEVYDPTGFVLDEASGTLTAFEPMDFFRNLEPQDKNRYAGICSKGSIESILELYKFMRGRRFDGHRVAVCKGMIAQYNKTLSIPLGDRRKIQQELNNFSISRTAFNPITQAPYIPGSAIKGALRTAYLNALSKIKKVSLDRREKNPANALEKNLLDYQKLENDPFRLLKISDFHPIGPCATKIVYGVNAKKTPSNFEARGPFQILEVIQPGIVFSGSIQILHPLSREVIKAPLSEEKVLRSARFFYDHEKKRENEELKIAALPVLNNATTDEDLIPLRLGRHSGAESLTVEGYRSIKIMKKRGERAGYADKATTFWLASDVSDRKLASSLEPFGWASLGRMTQALNDELTVLAERQEMSVSKPGATAGRMPPVQQEIAPPPPVEEIWDNAFVSFNAGSGGVVTAQSADKKTAEVRGKDKAMTVTDAGLHKKLFDGKKTLPKARVTVRKSGNAWEIVKVEPQA